MAAVLLLLLLGACVGPAWSTGSYRGKAANTADHIRSAVETTIVGIEAAERHGTPAAFGSVLYGEAETDAASAADTFASVQPPNEASDRIRDRSTKLFNDAVDELADVRIAARRGHEDELPSHLPALRKLSKDLDDLATTYRGGS